MQVVLARERIMGTSLGHEIAVPHGRLEDLKKPVLVLGHSREGIDFDSPDGLPSRLVFLLLTPAYDMSPQIQIMGQIARLFKEEAARQVVYESDTIEMVRAHIKTEMTSLVAH